MQKIWMILIILVTLNLQADYRSFKGYDFVPDEKTVEKYNPRPTIWVPIAETIFANLLLGSYNRYITESDFAQISFSSIKRNFKRGWNWDADGFFTNMWQHPFQGAVYYNTARSNGFNPLASTFVSVIGSLQWEYFMEIEPPSINDLVMTTLQGAIFGEVFYRISSNIIHERSMDKRVWRELGVMGFNPGRGFNRLVHLRSFRKIDEQLYKVKPYFVHIALGVNDHSKSKYYSFNAKRSFLAARYIYGNIFKQRTFGMMDSFMLDMELQSRPEFSVVRFRIYGTLWAKSFKKRKSVHSSRVIAGIFAYTDYMHNDLFYIGAMSLGPGLHYLSPTFWKSSKITFGSTIGFMPMSGVNSRYAEEFIPRYFEEGRDYNLSIGVSMRNTLGLTTKYVSLSFVHSFWKFFTIQGAEGREIINILETSLIVPLGKRLVLGASSLLYFRNGQYGEFPDITLRDREYRTFFSVKF